MYFHTRFHCTPLARQTLTCVLWLFYKKEFLQLLHDVEAVESLELPERETWVIKNKKKKLLVGFNFIFKGLFTGTDQFVYFDTAFEELKGGHRFNATEFRCFRIFIHVHLVTNTTSSYSAAMATNLGPMRWHGKHIIAYCVQSGC